MSEIKVFERRIPRGAVAWAWLTLRGNLAPVPCEREARSQLGRGIAALVKITLKKAALNEDTQHG